MIRRQRRENENGSPGLDISSLIDVSFLLLIYFLVTSTLDPREGDIGLTMPGKKLLPQVEKVTHDIPQITVDAAGVVSLETEVLETNPDSRTLTALEDRLGFLAEAWSANPANGDFRVSLEIDDSVPGQRFIDVMNCLAGLGIEKVSLDGFEEK